jgi:hypothetical protein
MILAARIVLVSALTLNVKVATTTFAFSCCNSNSQRNKHATTTSTATTKLSALSRRDALALATISTAFATATAPALADLDFSNVQDLLRQPEDTGNNAAYFNNNKDASSAGTKRPTWLVEPTDEFKQNEAKTAAFKQKQLAQKQTFLAALERLETDPNNEDVLANDLDTLRRQVRAMGGLPLGVTKDDVVVRVRRQKKMRKYWPTQVEVAYQDLILEIQYQQRRGGDTGSDKKYL